MAKFESSGKEEFNNAPTMAFEENKEECRPVNKPFVQPTVHVNEEDVQVINFPARERAKSPIFEPSF